jgi:hypothetical protein
MQLSNAVNLQRLRGAVDINPLTNSIKTRGQVRKSIVSCIVVLIAMLMGSVCSAQQVVDQSYNIINPGYVVDTFWNFTSGSTGDKAQTFTVGLAGQLSEVDVTLSYQPLNASPVTLRILPTVGGVPESPSSALASVTFQPANIPITNFQTIAMPNIPALQVTPGEVLAIALSVDTNNGFDTSEGWNGMNSNFYAPNGLYPSGTAYTYTSASPTWTVVPATSLAFQTWVTPTPEPASAILALAGCTLRIRRRRR